MLEDASNLFKFDNELNAFYKDTDEKWKSMHVEMKFLRDIFIGRLKIKKIVKPTPEDEIIFAYGRLCDYNWVAVDEDGQACFYEEKPCRSEDGNCWEITGIFNYIETKISCLSWKDEPYYIGE